MLCKLVNEMSDLDEYQITWNVGLIICHKKVSGTLEGVAVVVVLELYETKFSNFLLVLLINILGCFSFFPSSFWILIKF